MNFDEIDNVNSIDAQNEAYKIAARQKQERVELAQVYRKLFTTKGGQRVLEDLTEKFIYNNDTPLNSPNIAYESAFHSGEAGIVKYIIGQVAKGGRI